MRARIRNGLRIAIANASNVAGAGVAPGVPANAQSTRTPSTFMSFAMPDISIQPSHPQPQIPYYPDFWESAQKSQETPPAVPEEPLPKLSVISELDTLTSHNLHVESASTDTQSVGSRPVEKAPRSYGKGGILQDMSEDLGIPSPQAMKAGVSSFLQSFR
ncbi:hypothetical protein B0H12DRAFT_1228548 [Mycena haematopus]|nr:hypothetical protein B0H12DRAFT_1228548 [Mycena haematopus]